MVRLSQRGPLAWAAFLKWFRTMSPEFLRRLAIQLRWQASVAKLIDDSDRIARFAWLPLPWPARALNSLPRTLSRATEALYRRVTAAR